MEIISLIIADKDPDFLYQISKYILDREISFDLAVFTDINSLFSYSRNRNINILVISETFTDTINFNSLNADIKIITSVKFPNKLEGYFRITKNQKIESFINEITDIYFNHEMNIIMKEINITITEKTSIIGFFQISGGAGSTTLSLALSTLKAAENEPVFYVSLEKYDSSKNFLKSDKKIDSKDIKEVLDNKEIFELEKIYRLCTKDPATGIYYFPFSILEDKYFRYFYQLIDIILKSKTFSYIIIDFSCNIINKAEIFNLIDKKILLVDDNYFSLKKTELFLKSNDKIDNTILVLNKNTNIHLNTTYDFNFSVKIAYISDLRNKNNLKVIKNYLKEYIINII